MTDEKETTLYDLEEEVKEQVAEAFKEGLSEDDMADRITEIVDAEVPIYTSDLLDIAKSSLGLATEEPEVYGFDGKHTTVNAIAGKDRKSVV